MHFHHFIRALNFDESKKELMDRIANIERRLNGSSSQTFIKGLCRNKHIFYF